MTPDNSPQKPGAILVEDGVHFSVYASAAHKIELCLFDEKFREKNRIEMTKTPEGIWYVFVPGLGAGAVYGYRTHGIFAPKEGMFFDPQKVLLDPYAKGLARNLTWHKSLFPKGVGGDSTAYAPLGRVVDESFDWQGDHLPRVAAAKTVIYEAHVRGLTRNFQGIPGAVRGSYLALAEDKVIDYLKNLGVTTLELLPVHAKCDDKFLADRGLTNYWGYSTLNFFIPEPRYALEDPVREFKTMVRALHRAGIEVILDVVYNHTAEMGADGPILSLRGFDNAAYYLFAEGRFIDHTGCGNTLNAAHVQTRALILDSLRYWAEVMHVDGFRFDLAPALFREGGAPTMHSALAREIAADPVLSQLKLIAEPWDLGPDGYARDAFTAPWLAWNDRFRDAARRFWRGDGEVDALLHEMRNPAIVNYVTCHDGFTLRDLVSYAAKHNEANKEENRDGASENFSENYGHEGPSADAALVELRLRQSRNLLATLFFACGTPMLLAGDEIGHTQGGNNNAYCQDNAITHLAWQTTDESLRAFIAGCLDLRSRFDWSKAACNLLPRQDEASGGYEIRFWPAAGFLVFLVNTSPDENAVLTLPAKPARYRELLHTGRAERDEVYSEIFILTPRSAVLLQGVV